MTGDQPQSFTCPFCGRLGFTEATLHDHVTSEHSDLSYEVVSILFLLTTPQGGVQMQLAL